MALRTAAGIDCQLQDAMFQAGGASHSVRTVLALIHHCAFYRQLINHDANSGVVLNPVSIVILADHMAPLPCAGVQAEQTILRICPSA
jgi:hypothetical protein